MGWWDGYFLNLFCSAFFGGGLFGCAMICIVGILGVVAVWSSSDGRLGIWCLRFLRGGLSRGFWLMVVWYHSYSGGVWEIWVVRCGYSRGCYRGL